MGSYLNPGSKGFQESLNSEIYMDKTGLIEKTNAVLNTRQKFPCEEEQGVYCIYERSGEESEER